MHIKYSVRRCVWQRGRRGRLNSRGAGVALVREHVAVIPEAGTWVLMLTGLASGFVAGSPRRRRSRSRRSCL
jgi:hypothetical protein